MKKNSMFIRSIALLLTATVLFFAQGVYAEGGLPAFSEIAGHAMPSLGEALQWYPDTETENEDGSVTELYTKIREEEYNIFADYLNKQEATVADYQVKNGVLTAEIQANGASFNFAYNSITCEATVTYPNGTYDARTKRAKKHITEAEKLLQEGTTDEAYNEIISIPQYETYEPASRLLKEDYKLRTVPYRTIEKTVLFGRYEQDNDLKNGPEPIEWIVLDYDTKENKALLISRYGLDTMSYNWEPDIDITWETCSIRSELNNHFLFDAFTTDEQAAISATEVDNSASQGYEEWKTGGGKDTQDKIFLLSVSEARKYFGISFDDMNNLRSRISPTQYAVERGASMAWGEEKDKTADGSTAVMWWLRSPGNNQHCAADVCHDGSLRDGEENWMCVIRPAFWLDLNADIF